jgi:UDP:flavonoid glycosyltransferase YjiC (YdhE family)
MRFLFAFAGGRGHLDPLVPIAVAAKASGHTVAVTGRPAPLAAVEGLGFTVLATPGDSDVTTERVPLRELDPEREDRVLRDGFAGRIPRIRIAGVLGLCAEWQPDLIVCDETDFGSMVAAERLGLPHATVLVTAAGFVRPGLVGEPVNALRVEHGLQPEPELAMSSRYLVLSPFPPGYRDPAFPPPATAHSFRPVTLEPVVAAPFPRGPDGAPIVYFTLGTVFNIESGDLFARVLAGLRELPIGVVATVGSQIDPRELGPQPANVHVERYIPQASVLPHCSAVVSHGGSGSVLGTLAHGLPSVLIPMGADQPLNAARCEELGVARVLDAVRATPEQVREAVSAVLSDPTYRSAAERFRGEIAALPGPEHAVKLLERLATERRPLSA